MLEGISVDVRTPHRSGWTIAAAGAAVLTLVLVACAGPGANPSTTALPTPVVLGQVSLAPASEEATPAEVPDAGDIPSVAPPSGEPEIPAVDVEYDLGADDPDAFAEAYRSAFEALDLTDEDVDTAGARLCTYLMR